MRSIFVWLLLWPICITAQQKSVLSTLEALATKHQLELCYSSDLVNLKEAVDCNCDSLSLEACLKRLSYLSHLDISVDGQNLVVTHPGKQTIQMGGKVIDLLSGEELPFAHILQRDWGTGSISNTVGAFQVNVPKVLAGLKLEFSSMGYADTSVVIPVGDSTQLVIKLRPKPYNLNEVLVLPNGNTAEELVREAAKNIKRNYHRKTCQMEAFYRRTGIRDDRFVQLMEAALLVEDKGINMPSITTKIKLEEVRKSRNYLIPQDSIYKWASKRIETMVWGGHRNLFYKAYNNPVRNYKSDWWYQPLTQYDKFKYEFEGAMWMDTIKVYKIKYIYDWVPAQVTQVSKQTDFFDGGYIYINSADHAVVKFQHMMQFFEGHPNRHLGLRDGYMANSEYSYQKINGKYYLKYVKGLSHPNSKMFIYEKPDAADKDKKIKSRQWAELLLVVTNVITERQQHERIRLKEQLDRHENSYETNYPYNPQFWSTYGMLKQEPLPGKAIEDLEWEESLDVQFEENSTNTAEVKN